MTNKTKLQKINNPTVNHYFDKYEDLVEQCVDDNEVIEIKNLDNQTRDVITESAKFNTGVDLHQTPFIYTGNDQLDNADVLHAVISGYQYQPFIKMAWSGENHGINNINNMYRGLLTKVGKGFTQSGCSVLISIDACDLNTFVIPYNCAAQITLLINLADHKDVDYSEIANIDAVGFEMPFDDLTRSNQKMNPSHITTMRNILSANPDKALYIHSNDEDTYHHIIHESAPRSRLIIHPSIMCANKSLSRVLIMLASSINATEIDTITSGIYFEGTHMDSKEAYSLNWLRECTWIHSYGPFVCNSEIRQIIKNNKVLSSNWQEICGEANSTDTPVEWMDINKHYHLIKELYDSRRNENFNFSTLPTIEYQTLDNWFTKSSYCQRNIDKQYHLATTYKNLISDTVEPGDFFNKLTQLVDNCSLELPSRLLAKISQMVTIVRRAVDKHSFFDEEIFKALGKITRNLKKDYISPVNSKEINTNNQNELGCDFDSADTSDRLITQGTNIKL